MATCPATHLGGSGGGSGGGVGLDLGGRGHHTPGRFGMAAVVVAAAAVVVAVVEQPDDVDAQRAERASPATSGRWKLRYGSGPPIAAAAAAFAAVVAAALEIDPNTIA